MKKIFRNFMAFAIAAMAFTACEDVPAPYDVFYGEENVVDDAKGTGTIDDPFNAAAANAYAKSLGTAESPEAVYIKGKVVSIKENFDQKNPNTGQLYGNATFYIGDDTNSSETFYCYRVLYLGNKKYSSGDLLAEGDEVVVYGKVVNFGGNTPETVQGTAYLYSLNGNTGSGTDQPTGEAKGDGTLNNPFNSVAANNLAKSLASGAKSDNVYIKGKVVSIKENFDQKNPKTGELYGNATFYISDDGTETDQFYVFRTLYLGNKKYESGTLLNIGDEVIIYGKVTNYQGNTPETVQNESYLYSLNGKTEGGSDNPNPQPTNESSKDNPFTVAKALEVARALSSSETVANVYVKGVVVEFVSFDASYHNSRYYIADAANATDRLYIFDGKGLDNADLNAADDIKVGDEVIVYGTLSNYQGTTPEMNRGNYLVYHNGNGGGNDNPNPGQGGEVSGNTLTVTFSSMGFDNAQELTSITLSDGTTLTFDKGNNSNTPKYYNSGAAIRLYPSNYFTVKASKKIANIVLTCSSNNAEGQVTASPGTVNADGMTISVNSINANTVQINNAHTGTGATSQLRIGTLAITYAE
ncbi:MAG: hypothetical protein IJV24_00550 [Prevotella sp.]|nr:hypothetical protein [Prevotella sp.]